MKVSKTYTRKQKCILWKDYKLQRNNKNGIKSFEKYLEQLNK